MTGHRVNRKYTSSSSHSEFDNWTAPVGDETATIIGKKRKKVHLITSWLKNNTVDLCYYNMFTEKYKL